MGSEMVKPLACVKCIITVVVVSLAVSAQHCPSGEYLDTNTGKCGSCTQLCEPSDNHVPGGYDECSKYCQDYERVLRSTKKGHCREKYYYDKNVDKCEPCSTICDNHQSMGTTASCKKHCPQVFAHISLPTTTGPPCNNSGYYYDPAVSRCELCSSICTQHKAMGTTDNCKNMCPKAYQETLTRGEQQNNNYIIIAAFGAVLGVFTAAVVVLIVIKQRYPKNREITATPDFRPNHPTVSYVAFPIHTQCVDSSAEGLQVVNEEDGSLIREEEQKFPMAHADLPYSARRVSDVSLRC